MAKGHVEIHDPISTQQDPEGDAASPSDDADDAMEDTVEFRVMMAFAQRRRRPTKKPQSPKEDQDQDQDQVQVQDQVVTNGHTDSNGTSSPNQTGTDVTEEKPKKKKKKVWRRLKSLICVKPQTKDEDEETKTMSPEAPQDVNYRCGPYGGGARRDTAGDEPEEEEKEKEKDKFSDLAKKLTKLAGEIPFTPPELETDAPDDETVERMIGLLLRESGDRLNERELKDVALARELFWNYSFFRTLMSALLTRMGLRSPNPESPGPHASPKTQIAVTCEATSRLTALETLPANRLLGHGARYLNEYFSPWVQEQGGYDAAFEDDDEDDDEVQ